MKNERKIVGGREFRNSKSESICEWLISFEIESEETVDGNKQTKKNKEPGG